ncbi:MAG TPA: DUF3073 domain-containing protein [Intrasporangium sp.]|uniref:DUF3073 domain-containing protein n=1 Tax=Intrasporangium sp. TaxID=1925024 RepID=UPI002D7889F7|nr:DUF3073 domain-containing protein [Intrasporangium sp.]HET7397883.1 DUF3073 domain-containing protein [Intrasporangium sp.]
MGRGRAKAKQTKVARQLKYYTPDTDLSALERELHGSESSQRDGDNASQFADQDEFDDYGKWTAAGER